MCTEMSASILFWYFSQVGTVHMQQFLLVSGRSDWMDRTGPDQAPHPDLRHTLPSSSQCHSALSHLLLL